MTISMKTAKKKKNKSIGNTLIQAVTNIVNIVSTPYRRMKQLVFDRKFRDVEVDLVEFRNLRQLNAKTKRMLEPIMKWYLSDTLSRYRFIYFLQAIFGFMILYGSIVAFLPTFTRMILSQFKILDFNKASFALNSRDVFLIISMLIFLSICYFAYFFNYINFHNKIDLWNVLYKTIEAYTFIASVESTILFIVLLIEKGHLSFYDKSYAVILLIFSMSPLLFIFFRISWKYLINFIDTSLSSLIYKSHKTSVIYTLFSLLRYLNNRPKLAFLQLANKRTIINYLETISRDLPKAMCEAIGTEDVYFESWLKENVDGVIRVIDKKKS